VAILAVLVAATAAGSAGTATKPVPPAPKAGSACTVAGVRAFTPAKQLVVCSRRGKQLVYRLSGPGSPPASSAPTSSAPASPPPASSALPVLSWFRDHRTDRFPVDLDLIASGHPYRGLRAPTPHSGAHLIFDNSANDWPRGGTGPESYPAIYAVADGVIDRTTDSLRVGPNDRYGINLAIASNGNDGTWDFEYSIEPMAPEPSPGFYRPFMLVKPGDHVRKGQVIARFYLPPGVVGSHIHFELITSGVPHMVAPAIFTPAVLDAFHARWGNQGSDGGAAIPSCIGWLLTADESPFGEASDCLR
jgi:hypothetical protein